MRMTEVYRLILPQDVPVWDEETGEFRGMESPAVQIDRSRPIRFIVAFPDDD